MSSAGWFTRAKCGLELLELLDRPDLFLNHFDPLAYAVSLMGDRNAHERAGQLLTDYRRAVLENPVRSLDRVPRRRRRRPQDRRARTDAGRETDARDASAGNLVK